MGKVYSRFDVPVPDPAPAGTSTEKEYTIQIDDYGHKTLIQTGETNTYALIQASLEETKVENILKRATWDPETLNAMTGTYMDTTGMPTTLAQAQQMVIDATNEFERLPLDVRLKFDQSAEVYINEYGTTAWAEKLGISTKNEPKETPIEDKEVAE